MAAVYQQGTIPAYAVAAAGIVLGTGVFPGRQSGNAGGEAAEQNQASHILQKFPAATHMELPIAVMFPRHKYIPFGPYDKDNSCFRPRKGKR